MKPQVYIDPRPAEYFDKFHERTRTRRPDWVYELEKYGLAAVEAALKEALGPGELELPTDVNAIAAGPSQGSISAA